jgi:hypothetical protein
VVVEGKVDPAVGVPKEGVPKVEVVEVPNKLEVEEVVPVPNPVPKLKDGVVDVVPIGIGWNVTHIYK